MSDSKLIPFGLELQEAFTGGLGDVAWPVIGWTDPTPVSPAEMVHSDVSENDAEMRVDVQLPHFDPTNVEVAIAGALLVVLARVDELAVQRTFLLSAALDTANAKASWSDEKLSVVIPKKPIVIRPLDVEIAPAH